MPCEGNDERVFVSKDSLVVDRQLVVIICSIKTHCSKGEVADPDAD